MNESVKRNAKVISFYNFKGGVGKTTLAVNYAAWKSRDINKRVLLIDMDSQCNTTVNFLGFDKKEISGDPAKYLSVLNIPGIEIPSEGVSIPKIAPAKLITRPDNFNLFVIKGSYSLDDYWTTDKRLENRLDIMLEAIDTLRLLFDYIIIDLGPRDNNPTLNALAASDYVLVPITCDMQAIDGAERYFKKIYPVCRSINPTIQNLGIVANNFKQPSHNNMYVVDLADLAERYDTHLFDIRVRNSTALSQLCNWDFMDKARTKRCVLAFDKYIERNYLNAYQDVLSFVMEMDLTIAELEK